MDLAYDAEERVTSCAQNGKAFGATYDNGGRLQTVSYHDGALVVTYAYDSRNRLTGVTDSAGTDLDFAYDDAGRLTGITRASGGVASTYTYDAAGRLTRIQEGGFVDLQYDLNAAGEVAAVDYTAPVVPEVTAAAQALKFGKAGEIVSPGYAYDMLGRMTSAPGGKAYQWDGASRLVQAEGVEFTYNGLGDLVTREVDGQMTRFYHHYALGLAPIVYEDRPTGSDRAYVWTPGGRLLYSMDLGSNEPTFYHFDRMGSTLALSDDSGAVTDSYAYGPYGEALAHNGTSTQPFTYIGAFGVRVEGALYQMRARYYDPQTAQFLSRDPLPPRLHDVKSFNPYAYASQNPLRYVDPLGMKDDVSSVVGTVFSSMKEHNIGAYAFWWLAEVFLLQDERVREENALKYRNQLYMESRQRVLADAAARLAAWQASRPSPALPGHPAVFNGVDGSGHSDAPSFAGGVHVAVGDFDGSGRPQIIQAGGGGLFHGGGTIEISNSTVAGNSADSGPSQTELLNAMLLQHFLAVYNALKAAEDALLMEMQQSMGGTEAKVRAYEELKRQRKAFGKIIRSLGGTVPR